MSAIFEIEKQQRKYEKGSLEYLVAELMMDMCSNPAIDELFEQDLQKPEMSIQKAGKKLTAYAREHQKNNFYGMSADVARELICEMYGVTEADAQRSNTDKLKEKAKMISLEDFL